jgi:hypothetical protein
MQDAKPSIRDALLEQEGLAVGPLTDQRRKELEMLITRERARVRRMRWVTVVLWILLAGMLLFWGITGAEHRARDAESSLLAVLLVITVVLFPVAIVCTISLYIRWQIASRRDVDLQLRSLADQITRLRQQP